MKVQYVQVDRDSFDSIMNILRSRYYIGDPMFLDLNEQWMKQDGLSNDIIDELLAEPRRLKPLFDAYRAARDAGPDTLEAFMAGLKVGK